MLFVAQRVRTSPGAFSVNVAVYVHGARDSASLGQNPRLGLIDPGFKPSLMLTMREVPEPGGRVVSLLDIVFPDELRAGDALVLVDRLLLGWSGAPSATWSEGPIAARFYASPEVVAPTELRDLKAAMLPFFGHVSRLRGEAPVPVIPPQPVRIRRSRGARGLRYTLDPHDHQRLSALLARVLPASLSIADDTKDAFDAFALVPLEQVVVEALTGVPLDSLATLGGAVILDAKSGRVVWPE